MPELRRDPTTNEWVIIAPERAARPGVRVKQRPEAPQRDPDCPFCPGNEALTPPEISRRPERGSWIVRAVSNKYPALVPDLPNSGSGDAAASLRLHRAAKGHHEVIVEGPDHRPCLTPSDAAVLREALLAARERMRWLASRPGLAYSILFKNHGLRAGASLMHPHWQLAATPVVPTALRRMLAVAAGYRQQHGASVYARLIAEEVADGARIVAATEGYVTLTPYAPQWPGEAWVLPWEGGARFETLGDDALAAFAAALHDALRRVTAAFDDPDCNVVVYSAPFGSEPMEGFSWHVRIQPRLTVTGGFELATGMAIATTAPEDAAAALRACDSG